MASTHPPLISAPVCRQVEDNGPDVAEAWVAEQHDAKHTRQLLIIALIAYMEAKHRLGEAPN